MTTEWAHLPNAAHIDRVLASAKANPEHWVAVWRVGLDWLAACNMVKKQGRNAIWDAAWDATRDATREVARDASWNAAIDAIVALIAYDDCAYMLDSDPGELAILAKFCDPRAVLLLPACKAFHSLKTIA